jgi:hypothetical protein
MKKSEIKQLIREEFKDILNETEDPFNIAMNNLNKRVGISKGTGNTMGLPVEKLPNYNELPDSYDDQGEKNILLPSTERGDASERVYSKAGVADWVSEFMKKFGVDEGQDKIKFILDKLKNVLYEWSKIAKKKKSHA